MTTRRLTVLSLLAAAVAFTGVGFAVDREAPTSSTSTRPTADAEPADEPAFGLVQCANLIYGRGKTSQCFSDEFLVQIERDANVKTNRRFTAVKLESAELFEYPFAVMTGEGSFTLTEAQRKNLFDYLTRGGFLVASAGCSSADWSSSFLREIKQVFPDHELKKLEMSHEIFKTVYDIKSLAAKRGNTPYLSGLELDGRIVLIFTEDGLNDTANAGPNCCCCGGNEIRNAKQVNVNLLGYALTH